jgi:hypothetical protein
MTTNEELIVTDGVVTAQGYEPVIITQTVTNMPEGWTAPVVVEKQTTGTEAKFEGNIFDAEEEESRVFDPKISILEDEEQAQSQAAAAATVLNESSPTMLIMMIALCVVGVLLTILGLRYLHAYTRRQAVDHQRIKKSKEEYEMHHGAMKIQPEDYNSQQKLAPVETEGNLEYAP